MRLTILETKTGLAVRAAGKVLGFTPGPPAVFQHRPPFSGRHYTAALRRGLHGDQPSWSKGERELLAAFVSSRNRCVFWTQAHAAVAAVTLGDETAQAVLLDRRTAAITERLRAMLGFLERLTLTPGDVTPEDVRTLRAAGGRLQRARRGRPGAGPIRGSGPTRVRGSWP